jgi:uncharacterized protein YegL
MEDNIMKNQHIEIVFILDKSGSMSGLEADTIGGFNAMIQKQQKESGKVTVTTVLFDDRYQLLHDRIDLGAVQPLTDKEYYVEGSTALLDAIGKTINKIVNVQKHSAINHQAGKVLFIITTDGMENASREYSYPKIKQMIDTQVNEYEWEFIFLGANINAEDVAGDLGISEDRAVNYNSDSLGTQINYMPMNDAISKVRSCQELNDEWRIKVDEDYNKRG